METYKEQVASPASNLEETIPPTNRHRAIVLCFDGTGDQFDEDVSGVNGGWWGLLADDVSQNSNIVSFLSLLKKDDPSHQLVYYQVRAGEMYMHFTAYLRPWSVGYRHIQCPTDCEAYDGQVQAPTGQYDVRRHQ